MAARYRIKLDHMGIEAVLNYPQVSDEVREIAERIAAAIDIENCAHHLKVVIAEAGTAPQNPMTPDRSAWSVILAHPSGMAHEAKHGTLSAAAAAAGVPVTAYRKPRGGKRQK